MVNTKHVSPEKHIRVHLQTGTYNIDIFQLLTYVFLVFVASFFCFGVPRFSLLMRRFFVLGASFFDFWGMAKSLTEVS